MNWENLCDRPPVIKSNAVYWNKLFERTKHTYYTEFLVEFMCVLIIIFYFSRARKNPKLIFSVVLAMASLLQGLFAEYLTVTNQIFNSFANHCAILIYIAIEVTCCLLFIRASIKSLTAKKIILIEIMLFIFWGTIYWISNYTSWRSLQLIQIVEGFLIMLACLYYFYESLTQKPDKKKLTNYTFLIISSMLLLFGVISPLFLFLYFFDQRYKALINSLFIINYLAYALFFTAFAVGILRDKKEPSVIM